MPGTPSAATAPEEAERFAGRFAWLYSPGAPPVGLSPSRAEFEAACQWILDSWQVLPAVAPKLLEWGRAHGDSPWAERVRDRNAGLRALGIIQVKLIHRLAEALDRARIPYALLKSSALRFLSYREPEERSGKDIDIAVPRERVYAAQAVSAELGFVAAQFNEKTLRFEAAEPVLRARVESRHYELGFLARLQVVRGLSAEDETAIRRDLPHHHMWHLTPAGDVACYVTLDIHHGLSLDIDVRPLVETAAGDPKRGLRFPGLEWIALHLIFKTYWEGVHNYSKGGYQFADLVRLIPQLDGETFRRLTALLEKHNLEAAGYYVLRRLGTDLGLETRPDVERFLERSARPRGDRDPISLNDLGDMWPKLWGWR